MFKYLMKRAILIRVLVVFIFVFVCVELIQSYNFQILAVFKSVERRNVNDVREGPDQHDSAFKLALVNFKGFFDKSADYDVAMIDRKALPDCPNTFEALYKGRENSKNAINKTEIDLTVLEQLLLKNYSLEIGGRWTPKDCQPKYKIAIIIPYRDREDNLKLFLLNMHPFFANQRIQYGIYLIEPLKDLPFNRGLLMNIGYLEALKDSFYLWNCFFFHDVDMIPEDLKNLYSCDPNIPKHYAVAVSKWKYRTNGYFSKYYGGINAYTRDQFVQINGFSNSYFGWGGEDDDLRHRTIAVFKKFTKESAKTNRYFMNPHKSQKANPNRTKTLESRARTYTKGEITEGLTTVKYNIKRIEKTLLFTRIVVNHPSKEFT